MDALGSTRQHYWGYLQAYGYQTDTGVPVNGNYYLDIYVNSSTYAKIFAYLVTANGAFFMITKVNGTWGSWIKFTGETVS